MKLKQINLSSLNMRLKKFKNQYYLVSIISKEILGLDEKTLNELENKTDFYQTHKIITSYFRDKAQTISPNIFIAPFALKQGANLYGIIFGTITLGFLPKHTKEILKKLKEKFNLRYMKNGKETRSPGIGYTQTKNGLKWTELLNQSS